MREARLVVGTVGGVILLLGGVVWVAVSKTDISRIDNDSAGVKVTADSTVYDWGSIKIDGGSVEKTFEIRNEGLGTLKLFNVKTSCMCTTAQLSIGDEVSPKFGMHSRSNFVLEVPPQKTAQLKVFFDPAYHGPAGIGPITRQVIVRTNDPDQPELSFILTAVVGR